MMRSNWLCTSALSRRFSNCRFADWPLRNGRRSRSQAENAMSASASISVGRALRMLISADMCLLHALARNDNALFVVHVPANQCAPDQFRLVLVEVELLRP